MIYWIGLIVWLILMFVFIKVKSAEAEAVFVICTGIVAVLTVIIFGSIASRDANTQILIQQEHSLRWQSEENVYKYDDCARQKLADKVTDWNMELAKNKARSRNPWTYVFFPIDYDQFNYIPIELLEGHDE